MRELEFLIDKAKVAGADQVDAIQLESTSMSVAYRQGDLETMDRAEGSEIGLRVLVGQRQAVTSTSDMSKESLQKLVERAMDMVKVVPEDPYIGLADSSQFSKAPTAVGDMDEVATEELLSRARSAEESALSVSGVTQSEGAGSSWSTLSYQILTSEGFQGAHRISNQSLSCMVVAGQGEAMQRDYESTAAISGTDLLSPELVGRNAGERAVKRLNPRKIKTGHYPVIYHRRLGGPYLLAPLVEATNGLNVAKGTSFLKDSLGKPLFSPDVTIWDDPLLARGLGSRPFDREGIEASKLAVVEKGELKSWLLNLHAARQLGLSSTGHAHGGITTPPQVSATNFFIAPGSQTPEELLKSVPAGFYVTELMGFGINGITGDYSLGASGFWVENGEITYPVSEVTIAGNLKEMYRTLVPASDLVMDSPVCTPTVLIESMMVAGL